MPTGYFLSVGVHPWHADRFSEPEIKQRINYLIKHQNIKAVGEIGLDRVNGPDFHIQQSIFELQLQNALLYQKPVIVHCVKSYADLHPYIKKYKIPFILHDYNGNIQTTQQLLVHEQVYFSFGRALFRTNKSINSVIKEIPKNRLFLETDTMSRSIETTYAQMNVISGIGLDELRQTIFNNFQAIF